MKPQKIDAMALTSALVRGQVALPPARKNKPKARNKQAKMSRRKNRGK
jgi:hypothetical protein